MKTLVKSAIFALSMSLLAGFALPVSAADPILSASYQGGSVSSLQISVSNANAFSQVNLYTRQSSTLWTTINNLGQTDGNGNFFKTLNLPGDGSGNPIQMYITVGGSQSSTISVYPGSNGNCGYNGCGNNCSYYGNCNNGYGNITLSQTSLTLTSGQTTTVNIYNNNNSNYSNGSYYISSNSNSSIASASISGNQITIYGNQSGSTTISVCQNSGNAGCASLYVTVGGGYNGGGGNIWFDPSSPTMYVGQSLAVSINSSVNSGYSYNNNSTAYYISSNSNPNVVSATVSGTAMNLYASQSGSANISVCSSGLNFCGTLYVTVNGNGGYTGGNLSLSQTNVSLNVGQTSDITAQNYNGGSLYVSSNSNSGSVSVSISGSQISLYGINSGNSVISICANSSNQCASLYVSVGGGYGYGSLTFSPNNINMTISQSATVTVYGNGGYYISSNSNPEVVGATLTLNTIYLNSLSSGSSTITVCQNLGGNQCGSFYVTVSGYGSGSSSVWFSQNTANLNFGQTSSLTIYSNNYGGNYYVSSNTNSPAVSANVIGNQLNLYGQGNGSATVTVCQSGGGSNCGTVYVTVGSGSCGYNGCGSYTGGGSITLSQSTLNLSQNQSGSVTIYGNGGSYYISSNTNPAAASATISGNMVNVYSGTSGNTTVSICQNVNSSCVSLYITVNGSCGIYGCSGGSNTVNIGDDFFSPKDITVAAGTTVVWTNTGSMVHTVTADDNSFTSGDISPGQSFSHTFTTSGNFAYHCIFHGGIGGVGMSGVVTVTGSGIYYGSGTTLGASTYASGALISENGTVYIVYNNQKTAFASAWAFTGLGFNFSNVVNVGNSGLPLSGYTVTTSRSQHPWGSWIKDGGNTVYMVSQLGLIPVPDWNTFLNNGGQAAWIVPANSWDFSLPLLSPMTMSDARF